MMAFLRDISKSVIQYLNLSMKSKAILFSLYFIYSRNSKFSLSALLDNLSFSWRWIIIDSFWCWFYFLFSMLDRGYFKGIKSQQVLLYEMNKIQSWPVACSLRYLWYLYIPLLRALSLRIFTRSQVALNARWKVSENVFRMFDSTFSFVIFKILKFNFRNCCQIVVQNFQKVWKFDGKIRGIRIIRIRKNSIFLIEPLLFILFRSTKIPTRLSSSHTIGYYFFICSQLVRGKKEKQVNREFRGCCGEPVEFSSVKSLSGLRFRCAFCGPATSCQT